MGTLLLRLQQIRNGLPSLNVVVPALNVIHVKDVQEVQQHQKSFKQFHDMLLDDRRIKLPKIAETIGISKESVRYILHEKFGMKKLCARWVPRFLTADQKRTRMKISNNAWSLLTKIKLILCIDLLLWMRLGFTTTHQNPNSSQNSGQKPVVQHQKRQGRFHQQETSWHWCFGMLKAFIY